METDIVTVVGSGTNRNIARKPNQGIAVDINNDQHYKQTLKS